MTMPDGASMSYYYSTSTNISNLLSRVGYIKETGGSTWATYLYMGMGTVVSTLLEEPYVECKQYTTTLGDYPDLDLFGRVTSSRWDKLLLSPIDFYDVDIAYDRGSNITSVVDNIQKVSAISGNHNFDAVYTLDGLNRLTQADEGENSGGSIHSSKKARQELWSLSQTGNFNVNQLNLNWNADSDFSDTGEIDDTRSYNAANEMTQWQPTGAAYTPAINAVGATTDDGRDYRFVYDAFGRLRKVLNQSNVLRAEYTYNGLGYRIGWHFDADADGTVESNSDDPWFWFCYDEQWRIIATYRSTDSTPKERFVFHAAGLDGMGGSSYIDSVVYRDRDMMASSTPKAFREAGDGTLSKLLRA